MKSNDPIVFSETEGTKLREISIIGFDIIAVISLRISLSLSLVVVLFINHLLDRRRKLIHEIININDQRLNDSKTEDKNKAIKSRTRYLMRGPKKILFIILKN